MIDGQKCGDCVHWSVNSKNAEQGQCRGTYPQVIAVPQMKGKPKLGGDGILQVTSQPSIMIQPMFPPMLAEDPGCGQFYRDHRRCVEKDDKG